MKRLTLSNNSQDNLKQDHPETFIGLISHNLKNFSTAQRKIADQFIAQPELLSCFSLAELAKKTNSSQATIIRFCRTLGFDGFLQFSKEVQQALQAQLSVTDRFSLNTDLQQIKKREDDTLSRLLEVGKNNLSELQETIISPQFKACIEAMKVSDTIFILGRLSSYPIALHFYQMLSKITNNVVLLDRGMMQNLAMLNKITEKSLLFSVAFPRYPRVTLDLARQAAEHGATIVSVTNSRLCPTVPFSTYTLLSPVSMVSYIDVFISPVALLSALAIAFAQRCPETAQKNLAAFDKYSEINNIFIKCN